MNLIQKVFGTHSERELKRIEGLVQQIEDLRPSMQALSDAELAAWDEAFFTARNKDGEEILCGLRITDGSFSDGGEVYLSVSKKAPHMELVRDFIRAQCGLQ